MIVESLISIVIIKDFVNSKPENVNANKDIRVNPAKIGLLAVKKIMIHKKMI